MRAIIDDVVIPAFGNLDDEKNRIGTQNNVAFPYMGINNFAVFWLSDIADAVSVFYSALLIDAAGKSLFFLQRGKAVFQCFVKLLCSLRAANQCIQGQPLCIFHGSSSQARS